MTRILLASASPRRRELLSLLGFPFETTVSDVDESPAAGEEPAALVTRLSLAKARAACNMATAHTDAPDVVVACDTIVALDGTVLGKPHDEQDALDMLRRLRARAHTVYSALALVSPTRGRVATSLVETVVVMRDYTAEEIARYIASGDPFDKAGAYAIQHGWFRPVARLRGCYANVMGLPLCHLAQHLRDCDIEVPHEPSTACQNHTGHICHTFQTVLHR